MSLSNLSNEVISQILEYLSDHYKSIDGPHTRTLCSLSVCSRHFHDLVEPILYASFKQTTDYSLGLFLRTILSKAKLARHVKKFKARHRDLRGFFANDLNTTELDRRGLIWNGIKAMDVDRSEALIWIDCILDGDWNAVVALAIASLPSLQHLALLSIRPPVHDVHRLETFDGNYDEEERAFNPVFEYWTNKVLKRARALQQLGKGSDLVLGKLKRIQLQACGGPKIIAISQVTSFLDLQSIQTLKIKYVDTICWDINRPISFQTTSLELQDFRMQEDYYKPFFACFPLLQRLRFDHIIIGFGLDIHFLLPAIKHLEPCLKELTLKSSEWHNEETHYHQYLHVTDSLVGFERLEIVEVMAYHLKVWGMWVHESESNGRRWVYATMDKVLPKSVRNLILRQCEFETVSGVLEWKKKWVGSLEVLHLDCAFECDEFGNCFTERLDFEEVDRMVVGLREECEGSGVTLILGY